MTFPKLPAKDPADELDESFDFSLFLDQGDTITEGAISASPSGLTLTTAQINGKIVTTRVSGGTIGVNYTLSCQISTASGNVVNRSATILVKDL